VLLATPLAFRPLHVECAIAKGCHVFMEKSFGVDTPGVRRILNAGEDAKARNLKIAGGLMSRHSKPLEEAIGRIHDGAIGDVITCYAYWLIHNLDVCCWVKGAWPVSCQGQGGRQVRTLPDQLFDHYAVEYTFPDGTRLIAEARHMDQCWGSSAT
jgi:myo-inositol 2-dehydrogenase/D-chiro-inositol 1-dehydrogenase